MKTLSILALFAIAIWSCKNEDINTPDTPIMEEVDTTATTAQKGVFVSAPGETVKGNAKIITSGSTSSLVLENLMANNGPDLHVYLATDTKASNFIDLGALKSTNGTQVYVLPNNIDFGNYKYALIHCQQFNVLFGSALLN
ncbi:electron transfer DM13 [Dyadobacter jejuensis]|uniref:Electron transfer DM13 n=1 Tax=Dyadobacter jejuensis TaxID=1082580 RepID=A0A316B869_9BACT|nr:DM13 domain-containing protein [Dyadobacter jejuensis]PWJ58787.1 electron transfer DM13 [Dyadobacter jejuensis]